DIARGPRPVLDDERLAEAIRQPLPDQARKEIGRPAGGKPDDDTDRPRRIGLRAGDPRQRRQCGSTRGQAQKSSAGKMHGARSRKYVPKSTFIEQLWASGYLNEKTGGSGGSAQAASAGPSVHAEIPPPYAAAGLPVRPYLRWRPPKEDFRTFK